MKIEFSFPFTEQEFKEALDAHQNGNPKLLRSLCQKEVEGFEAAIRQHPDYQDGLVRIERRVVEGYLYQRLKGCIQHADPSNNPLPKEQSSGT